MAEVKKQKKSRSYWAEIWRLLVRNKGAMIGMAVVIMLVVLACTVDIIYDYDAVRLRAAFFYGFHPILPVQNTLNTQ